MRYKNLEIEDIDLNIGDNVTSGNFIVCTTDELIDITNNIRLQQGNTDIVSINKDNDVYYTFYLMFDANNEIIKLIAECNHGEKDDYVIYELPLSAKEKEKLMFLIIKFFVNEELLNGEEK